LFFLLGSPLALQYDALELLEDGELFVGVVNLGITLFLGNQETNLFETLEFTLDITGVFLNELR
jgi:hypothetical protein